MPLGFVLRYYERHYRNKYYNFLKNVSIKFKLPFPVYYAKINEVVI